VLLLKAAADNPIPGQITPLPVPVEVNGEQVGLVETVLDSRIFGRWKTLQYLIKWKGYDKLS
jgi:hypothetical protein